MKPAGLNSRIFIDSGDPVETKAAIELLGFLNGQTTNPTLVAKNPHAKARFDNGQHFSKDEILEFYKELVKEVSALIPEGSVSIEVYADKQSTAQELFAQGQAMFQWISNAHIKYPTTAAGLEAAEMSVQDGIKVNMTLCFTQEQAAAVHAATKGAKKGDVFVSPFIGRLDDIGENGLDLVKNIIQMYKAGNSHVEVLAASVRSMDHFMQSLAFGSDIITAPFSILKEWGEAGMPLPDANYSYKPSELREIPYKDISLDKSWASYDIAHELTDKGIERFTADWNEIIAA